MTHSFELKSALSQPLLTSAASNSHQRVAKFIEVCEQGHGGKVRMTNFGSILFVGLQDRFRIGKPDD